MLKFNTYRAKRYLRSKFLEGKYLLASEATDLELELLQVLRKSVQDILGEDVAIEDAWKVEKISDDEILIKPGEAWFKGLPYSLRGGNDQLVSGAILALGTVPTGVQKYDDSTGLGKIIKFGDTGVTPSNVYKIIISAEEELVTEVQDPFLQNANLTESTAQKIRLVFKINIVPNSLQDESPVPYRDESSATVAVTNFPNVGGTSAPNFVNQIVITPQAGQNGELVDTALITGAEKIDGRDVELTFTNVSAGFILPDTTVSTGNVIPKLLSERQAFSNGTLIDSNGNSYHINVIIDGAVSTEDVIRIDKEPGQPNPVIDNTRPFKLIKRDVFVTNDSGIPQGKLYWSIATVDWHQTNKITHDSKIVDLRNVAKSLQQFEDEISQKIDLIPTGGGDISFSSNLLTWASDIKLISAYGPAQEITASSVAMLDGGSLVYELDLTSGGVISKGDLSLTVTASGATVTMDVGDDLTDIRVGNVLVRGTEFVQITAINNVTKTLQVSPALTTTGSCTVYLDSFAASSAPLTLNSYVLAVREGSKVWLAGGVLELETGETNQLGDGTTTSTLDFIGATDELDDAPAYTSTNYVTAGDSLVKAISDLDTAVTSLAVSLPCEIAGGGVFSWNSSYELSFTQDIYLEVKGFEYIDNTIDSTESPITFTNDYDVLYVIPNLTPGGPNLTPVVSALDLIPTNGIILARRVGTEVIVGSNSIKLKIDQSSELASQASDQNLSYIGASSTSDDTPTYSSDIRGVAGESLTARLGTVTDSIGDSQEDRSAYFRSDDTITWTGTQIQFTSDIILEVLNTKTGTLKTATILAANSPIALADGESAWISVDRTSSSENVTVNLTGTTPLPAQTQADKDVFLLARRKDVLSSAYLHIPLHKQIIDPSQTLRLGGSGGIGGTVNSLNSLSGNVSLAGTGNINLSSAGSTITITDATASDIGVGTSIDASLGGVFYNTISANKNYIVTNLLEGQTIKISISATGGNRTISFNVNSGLPLAYQNSIIDLVVEDQTIQYYWITLINGIAHIVSYTNLINQGIPIGVAYNTPSQSYQKTAYSLTISTNGTGGTPTNFALQTGSLPPNMTINSLTGEISGTPASGSSIGNFAFTIRASNIYGYQDIPVTINVDVPNEWPLGSGGNLTVLNGQTTNLTTGVYDYANVTIEQGGTLTVGSHVIIGCRYDFKCSGVINGNGSNTGGTFNLVHPIYGSTSYTPAAYNTAGTGGAGGQANGQPGGAGGAASNGYGGGGGGGASADYTRTNGASGGTGGTNAGSGNSGGTPTSINWNTSFTTGAVGGTNNAAINGANASAQNGGAGSLAVALSRSGGGGGAAGWLGNQDSGKEVRFAGAGGGGGGGGNRGSHGSRIEVYTHRSITQNGVQPAGNIFSNGTNGTVSGAGGTGGTYTNGVDPNYGGGGGGSGGGGSGGNGGDIVLRYRVAQTIGTSITAGSAGSFAAAGPGGTGTAGNGSSGSTGTSGSNGTIGTTTTQLLT